MTCDGARELLSALLDDALASGERAALDAHLGSCASCRRERDRLAATVAVLGRLPRPRAPDGFVDRVMASAHPRPWSRRLLAWLFVPLAIKLPVEVAALVLVGVAALWVHERTDLARVAPESPAVQERPVPAPAPTVPSGPEAPPAAHPPASAPVPETRVGGEVGSTVALAFREERVSASAPVAAERAGPPAAAPAPAERERAVVDARAKAAGATTEPPGTARVAETLASRDAGAAPGAGSGPAAPSATGPEAVGPTPGRQEAGLAKRAHPSARGALEARAVRPPDVAGRLVVPARGPAEQALEVLVARLGATRLARRLDEAPGAPVVIDLVVAREAYAALAGGLADLGRWTPERAPATLPAAVHVQVTLTE
jgi:hypothetical protein